MKYMKNAKDVFCKTKEEVLEKMKTLNKDHLVFELNDEEFSYVISKEIYEDLKIYGLNLPLYGKDYLQFSELEKRMSQYHGPAVLGCSIIMPFDFIVLSMVTYEIFGDAVIENCLNNLQEVIKYVFELYSESHLSGELSAYKSALRASVFMNRLGSINMQFMKNQQNLAKGIVVPGTSINPGNNGKPFSKN